MNMDDKELLENLRADLICSICLGYFTDPVTVKCGHSFCTECLVKCREGAEDILTCPECRQVIQISNLVPNKNLQNLSITSKIIRPHLLQSIVGLITCDQHGEKEKLFCEEDKRSICDSCFLASEHKDHQVLPLDRAADKCKEKLQETWNILQRKEEEFKISLDNMRRRKAQFKVSVCFLDAESERRICHSKAFLTSHEEEFMKMSIISEYKKMHQFLWDEECIHLQRLDQESRENLLEIEEKIAKLSQQIQNLQQRILKVEVNLDKAPLEMLQDMKDTLARNEELLLQEPEVPLPFWSTCPITGLREILMSFQRDITLDPETAHPNLILSEDLKNVKYTSVPQDVPNNRERFDCALTVLGAQTFTSSRHYWEVKVEDKTEWSVGICTDSVSRNGRLSLLSKDLRTLVGFKYGNDFFLWNSQNGFHESPPIHKMGIFLDYERGHIAFYDVSDKSLIYSTPNITFQGHLHLYLSPCCPNKENIPGCPWPNQEMPINNYHGRLSLISD
uniref:Probable E3 ubiquitin-protein ligase TRIML1 n=1 Tax=Phascolarctos cinereus TaxID=38626 RepID=A0A6P5L641_PHACI|nr:probable E3 ubiquitin-protein ligase TRIML1 [Phascolarctos cinereus]